MTRTKFRTLKEPFLKSGGGLEIAPEKQEVVFSVL